MATYYKYQERDPSSEINWAEVGANFSGMLQEESRVRTEKKQAIDDSTREQQRVLDNAVQGDSANMNQWTLDYAANATEQMMMTNRLMKSGDLSMKEFTMMRQNLSDGTDQAFTLSQEYQSEYADKMARADCKDPSGVGCSQQLELDMMASAEGFGNFNKSQLVIDPQTGKVNVGFYKDNGEGVMELDSNPNSLVGINNLRNRIKGKIELYDMSGEVAKAAESFGKYEAVTREIGSLYRKGQITITSDVTQRGVEIKESVKSGLLTQDEADRLNEITPGWDSVEDAWLEGQLSNTYNVSSLLTNNLGQIDGVSYSFTWDEKEVDATTILLKNVDGAAVPDWETKFGKEQRQKAKDGLRTVLRGALDHTQKVTTPADSPGFAPAPSAMKMKFEKEKDEQLSSQRSWNSLFSLTPAERNSILGTLLNSETATSRGLIGAEFSADGSAIEYRYQDPSLNNIVTIPENPTESQWAILGNAITGLEDPTEAASAGNFGGDFMVFDPTEGVGARRSGNASQYKVELANYIEKDLTSEALLDLTKEQVEVAKIITNGPLGALGFTAIPSGSWGGDNTKITHPSIEEIFDLDSDFNDTDSGKENAATELGRFNTFIAKALASQTLDLAKKNKWIGGSRVPSSRPAPATTTGTGNVPRIPKN